MKYTLKGTFRWKILSEDGLLKEPKDKWGNSHLLAQEFTSREEAIGLYARLVDEGGSDVPNSLVLIEEHYRGINWEE